MIIKSCKQCLFNSVNNPTIQLNSDGICDICYVNIFSINLQKDLKKQEALENKIKQIKKNKKGKYDCLIGISGGADSSFLVYLAMKWGLNPLLLHIDGGWNSETSITNIKQIIGKSRYDYVSEVLPWDELREVQRSFILANVLDIDLPFDNLLTSYTYRTAQKYNIKYILNGDNIETEGIMPSSYTHYKLDKKNILDIHKKMGNTNLANLNFIGTFGYFWFDRIKKIKCLSPLNWVHYNKEEAKKIIKSEFNWKDYGGKHYENIFTRFYQGHILPMKFNIDKRLSHLSILICSKQLSKEEANKLLKEQPIYPSLELEREDRLFFLKKLNFSENDFIKYLDTNPVSHRIFKSDLDLYDFFKPFYKILKRFFRFKIFN